MGFEGNCSCSEATKHEYGEPTPSTFSASNSSANRTSHASLLSSSPASSPFVAAPVLFLPLWVAAFAFAAFVAFVAFAAAFAAAAPPPPPLLLLLLLLLLLERDGHY